MWDLGLDRVPNLGGQKPDAPTPELMGVGWKPLAWLYIVGLGVACDFQPMCAGFRLVPAVSNQRGLVSESSSRSFRVQVSESGSWFPSLGFRVEGLVSESTFFR